MRVKRRCETKSERNVAKDEISVLGGWNRYNVDIRFADRVGNRRPGGRGCGSYKQAAYQYESTEFRHRHLESYRNMNI